MMNKVQEHDYRLEEIDGTLTRFKSELAKLAERIARPEKASRPSGKAAKGFGYIGAEMGASGSKR